MINNSIALFQINENMAIGTTIATAGATDTDFGDEAGNLVYTKFCECNIYLVSLSCISIDSEVLPKLCRSGRFYMSP